MILNLSQHKLCSSHSTLHSSKIVLRILKIGFLQISGVAGCAADVRLALHARAGRDR